jgi:hypothetical protein
MQTVLMFRPVVHALNSVNSQDNSPKLLNYLNGKLTCAADIHKLQSLCVKSSMFSGNLRMSLLSHFNWANVSCNAKLCAFYRASLITVLLNSYIQLC